VNHNLKAGLITAGIVAGFFGAMTSVTLWPVATGLVAMALFGAAVIGVIYAIVWMGLL
jgi:hypothetical protein